MANLGSGKTYNHQEQYSLPYPKSVWLLSRSLLNAELCWDLTGHSYTHTALQKLPWPFWFLIHLAFTGLLQSSTPPCLHSLNILCCYHKIKFRSWGEPWNNGIEWCRHNRKASSASWHYM